MTEPDEFVVNEFEPSAPASEAHTSDEATPEKWQALSSKWNAILGLEAQIETLRLAMESMRVNLDAAFRQALGVEDRMHALQNDVAEWTKAKSRVHFALPRVREFIHRANLALCLPERKRLGELFETHIQPRVPFAGMDKVREEMEHLIKDRQGLLAMGNATIQDCRVLSTDIQRALHTLRQNAAKNARRKRAAR